MKTVLLITTREIHRKLYEKGLREHFAVEFSGETQTEFKRVDAVIYDIPTLHSTIDTRWLQELDVPVVVLTCEERLRLPRQSNRRVLSYPVRMDEILRALAELGVEATDDR